MGEVCHRADCSRCARVVCLDHIGRTCETCGAALCESCRCPDGCEDGAA